MEVRKGYKQTEVGIIPEDWDVTTLGEILEFKNGLNKEKKYFGQGTPIVNYMDVYKNNGIYSKDIQGRVTLSNQEIKNYEVKKGDVFFTRTSETVEEIGITTVVLDEVSDTVFSGFVLRARHKDKRMLSDFEKYCYGTPQIRKEITSKSSYTTRALTNGRALSKVKIAVPSLAEQEAIAEALSDADALIEAVEQLLAKKRQVKQGTMSELLAGKRRLSGFKEKWKEKKVWQFGDVVTGGTPPTSMKEYWDGNIPWVTPTDLSREKDIATTEREITLQGLSVLRKLPANSVLVTCIASIGKNAILRKEGACNQQINAIVPNNCHDANFLYYLFENSKQFLLANAGTTATSIISKKDFSELTFSVPELLEQTAIAEILSDMDAEISALEEKLVKARQVKAGMMSELLTGKIRLI